MRAPISRASWRSRYRGPEQRVAAPVSICESRGAQQASIYANLGSFDQHRADRLCVIIGRSHAADDGVAETLLLHVLETGQQQGRPDAALPCLRCHTGGSEKVAASGVMAGKARDPAVLDRDEAGHRLPAE